MGWFFYVWQPQLVALQQQQQTLQNQQQSQTMLFQSKQEELQQEMQQQLVNVVADWTNKQQAQAEKAQQELSKLQTQLDQQSGNVKGWQLLEVEYFLRLAEQKLFLEQNVTSVVQVQVQVLLELAEQRLKQMQDASLVAVREAISQDKHMLAELNTPDMHQLHLTLSALRQQSLTLPLRQSEWAMDNQAEKEITEDAADWQQADAKVLILRSMPRQVSLDAQQYYGHPRNQFWPLMQQLFAVDSSLPYAGRLTALQQAGVALWDVIGVCQRQGSLDSAIQKDSVAFNPLLEFCQTLPQLQQIWLNGGKAASSFLQYQRQQQWPATGIHIRQLPSTSPAHASLNFEAKLRFWRAEKQ